MKTSIAIAGVAAVLLAGTGAAQACDTCYRKVTTPPVYGTFTQQVLVRPARVEYTKIPAQYATVQERVMVRPAQRIAHAIPAITRQVAETVMVQPATKRWSVTRDWRGHEIGCWVAVPARYETRYRTVVVREAGVAYSIVPAEYTTLARTVEVSPGRLVPHTIPAVVGTRTQTRLVQPATTAWRPLHAPAALPQVYRRPHHHHRHAHHDEGRYEGRHAHNHTRRHAGRHAR